jgi:hypothetical protein
VPSTPRTIYVHIGPPKTGTTYLQQVLWANRELLRTRDVDFPGSSLASHFHAALDLREIRFGGYDNPDVPGAWARLAGQALASRCASVVISHEVFGGSTPEQIARFAADLSGPELHVVCGARDLARQLPAVWQESLKNRRTRGFEAFVEQAMRVRLRQREPRGFWRGQDTVAMLERWSAVTDPSRVHLVTLPQSGAGPNELWARFCRATGIEPSGLDLGVARSNASLNAEDAELLRRLNEELPEDLPWPAYERLVKRRFRRLAEEHAGSGTKVRLPASYAQVLGAYAADICAALSRCGYDIVGSLDDLAPRPESFEQESAGPGAIVSDAEVTSLARKIVRKAKRDPRTSRTRARTLMAQLEHRLIGRRIDGRDG